MPKKKVFLRMCRTCLNPTVIIKQGDEEATCPVCDANHTVEWLPRTHAIIKGESKQ